MDTRTEESSVSTQKFQVGWWKPTSKFPVHEFAFVIDVNLVVEVPECDERYSEYHVCYVEAANDEAAMEVAAARHPSWEMPKLGRLK